MVQDFLDVRLDEINPNISKVIAADTSIAAYIKYVGSAVSGIIIGDGDEVEFLHGAAASEVADTTVNTTGTIDYGTDGALFSTLAGLVNASANWEWIWSGARPDVASEISNVSVLLATSSVQCKPGGSGFTGDLNLGYPMYFDRSTSLYHAIGITNIKSAAQIHNHDAGVYNMVRLIKSTLTYATPSTTNHDVKIWEVDEKAGTSNQIGADWGNAATTVTLSIPTSGGIDGIIFGATGKRIVIEQISSTQEPTVWDLEVWHNSIILHPAPNAAIINPEFNA